MKTCTKCLTVKALSDFSKRARSADGLRYDCRACVNEANAAWKAANAEKVAAMHATWYPANAERLRAGQQRWKKANLDRHCAYQARRRATKLRATPAWADHAAIAEVYARAQAYRELGCDAEVDHYYPLKGKNVSGLHVHQNLQVLLAQDNRAKHNKHPEGGT